MAPLSWIRTSCPHKSWLGQLFVLTQPASVSSSTARIFSGNRKYKLKLRTWLTQTQDLLRPNIGLYLKNVCWGCKQVRVGASFCSLCTAPNATVPKPWEGSSAASSNYSSACARRHPSVSMKETCLLSCLHPCPWIGLATCFSSCFPFRLTSDTRFPLDWKQVCWKLSALSSLYNVDCCLAPIWKQLFPYCTYPFWKVKDLSLDFFCLSTLLAASFIKKSL